MRSRLHHVEVTERSVHVDGVDMSMITADLDLEIRPGSWPRVTLWIDTDLVTYVGRAEVSTPTLDGIERLRTRLNRQRSVDLIAAFEAAQRRTPEVLA
jgi:hypothetical protein